MVIPVAQQAFDILVVELSRRQAEISIGKLCRTARIARSTYARQLKRPGSGRIDTVKRLQVALGLLQKEPAHV